MLRLYNHVVFYSAKQQPICHSLTACRFDISAISRSFSSNQKHSVRRILAFDLLSTLFPIFDSDFFFFDDNLYPGRVFLFCLSRSTLVIPYVFSNGLFLDTVIPTLATFF